MRKATIKHRGAPLVGQGGQKMSGATLPKELEAAPSPLVPALPAQKPKLEKRIHISPITTPIRKNELVIKQVASVVEGGDPRNSRHVSRGRREIDATIDLHGMTQDQAYVALQQFLMQAKVRKDRVLLVITGKGRSTKEEHVLSSGLSRGILRQRFLQWIDGPFRDHVARVSQAHQRHGGSGAFYVFLKGQKA